MLVVMLVGISQLFLGFFSPHGLPLCVPTQKQPVVRQKVPFLTPEVQLSLVGFTRGSTSLYLCRLNRYTGRVLQG